MQMMMHVISNICFHCKFSCNNKGNPAGGGSAKSKPAAVAVNSHKQVIITITNENNKNKDKIISAV